MQNIIINDFQNKVVNIKSEILFREAEDEFFYFNHISKAADKLKEAIALTPNHIKSIMLYADICFMKGCFKKALALYSEIEKNKSDDSRVLASIANCHNALKNPYQAIKYSDLAIKKVKKDNYSLISQIMEIKINNLLNLNQYSEAQKTFFELKNILKNTMFRNIYISLSEKIKRYKKLHYSGLKIV